MLLTSSITASQKNKWLCYGKPYLYPQIKFNFEKLADSE